MEEPYGLSKFGLEMFIAWVQRSCVPIFVKCGQNMWEEELKVCFEENSKWRKIYPGANGRGLYGELRHDPRNLGKKDFYFTTYGSRVIGQNVKGAFIAPP